MSKGEKVVVWPVGDLTKMSLAGLLVFITGKSVFGVLVFAETKVQSWGAVVLLAPVLAPILATVAKEAFFEVVFWFGVLAGALARALALVSILRAADSRLATWEAMIFEDL